MSEAMKNALAACTPDEKAGLLAELANEIFATRGPMGYSIQDQAQKTIGYLTPGPVNPASLLPDDAAWRSTIQKRIENPGRTLSLDQFLNGLEEEAPISK